MDAHLNTVVFNEALVYSFAKEAPEVVVLGVGPGLIATDIRRTLVGYSISFFYFHWFHLRNFPLAMASLAML